MSRSDWDQCIDEDCGDEGQPGDPDEPNDPEPGGGEPEPLDPEELLRHFEETVERLREFLELSSECDPRPLGEDRRGYLEIIMGPAYIPVVGGALNFQYVLPSPPRGVMVSVTGGSIVLLDLLGAASDLQVLIEVRLAAEASCRGFREAEAGAPLRFRAVIAPAGSTAFPETGFLIPEDLLMGFAGLEVSVRFPNWVYPSVLTFQVTAR